jgi:DNA-binding CsgD family transcriptional regulator
MNKLLSHIEQYFIDPLKVKTMIDLTRELQHIQINHFTYVRISKNYDFSVLSNRPDTVRYYFQNQLALTPINGFSFEKHLVKGGSFWNILRDDSTFSQVFKDYNEQFSIGNLAGYYRYDNESVEMFGFGSKHNRLEGANFYINFKSELESFALEFLDKSSSLRSESSKNYNRLPLAMAPGLEDLVSMSCNSDIRRFKLIQTIEKSSFNWGIFSKRELDCIECLFLSLTTKEIAKSLGLSKRTVEHYLENIKSKLGCNKKSEILRCLSKTKY